MRVRLRCWRVSNGSAGLRVDPAHSHGLRIGTGQKICITRGGKVRGSPSSYVGSRECKFNSRQKCSNAPLFVPRTSCVEGGPVQCAVRMGGTAPDED